MEEQNVIIEITDTEIRLLIGYVKDKKPHISYTISKPTDGLISRGEITDFNGLVQTLSSLKDIRLPESKEKININDVTVILPALGLNIYESIKTTNVVSNDSIIEQIDIENVVSQISKEKIPNNTEIVDIIPDEFVLDGGIIVTYPPLGQKSNSLTMKAKIQTLPSRIVSDYRKVVESAHISVRRLCLSPYAASELGKTISGIPENYILVDMGSEICDITLVGHHSPYETVPFQAGGSYVVNELAEKYGIAPEKGLNLLTRYGFNERKFDFTPVIETYHQNGECFDFTQADLNVVIEEYFKNEFFPRFDVALDSLLKDYNEEMKQLPIVFTGGFSMMIGFDLLAKNRFSNKSILFLSPNTIGARTPQYTVCVGALLVSGANKGSLSDQRQKLRGLSR